MPSASASLQKAVFSALNASTSLTDLLGGARIFDDMPPQVSFPYVTFGQSQERDWSTGSESGGEHILTVPRLVAARRAPSGAGDHRGYSQCTSRSVVDTRRLPAGRIAARV